MKWNISRLKDDFQSLLRSLRVCFRFCFEFVDMLHFGNSIHEVFESPITSRYESITPLRMLDELQHLFGIMLRFSYSLLLFGYLALIMKKKVSLSQNFYLGCVYIPSCEAHKHCRAEVAQYRLEIIFKCAHSYCENTCSWLVAKLQTCTQVYTSRLHL